MHLLFFKIGRFFRHRVARSLANSSRTLWLPENLLWKSSHHTCLHRIFSPPHMHTPYILTTTYAYTVHSYHHVCLHYTFLPPRMLAPFVLFTTYTATQAHHHGTATHYTILPPQYCHTLNNLTTTVLPHSTQSHHHNTNTQPHHHNTATYYTISLPHNTQSNHHNTATQSHHHNTAT